MPERMRPDTLPGVQALARDIGLPSTPADINAALARISGDIAHALDHPVPHVIDDLEREFGNLLLSAARWIGAHGLDIHDCIAAAETAQRAYAERQETHRG